MHMLTVWHFVGKYSRVGYPPSRDRGMGCLHEPPVSLGCCAPPAHYLSVGTKGWLGMAREFFWPGTMCLLCRM